MHELALAQGLVDLVTESARQEHFTRVRAVHLDVGLLSSVMPEALAFSFEVASRDTVAAGAELKIRRPPGTGWCSACSREVTVETRPALCPDCGGAGLRITGGDQLRVIELEVD